MSNEILFMVGAAAMVAVSMLFLLPPLLGRSREVGIARRENNLAIFQQRREELKQDLQQEEINEVCIVYLNRLSDALFTAARWVNMSYRTPEVEWKPGEQE